MRGWGPDVAVDRILPVRRVVVGPDEAGGAVVAFDGPTPHVAHLPGMPPPLGLTDV